MITHGAGRTHVGRRRDHNEDAFTVAPDLGLYVVADGMGGHAGGEVASALAVRTVGEVIRDGAAIREKAAGSRKAHREMLRLAEGAFARACTAVHRRAQRDAALAGMGCAMTMLLVSGSRAVMAHVGDTRLYLRRDGEIEQLSTDHTMGHELVQRGAMTAGEVARTRYGHALTRAIGHQPSVEVDTLMLDLVPDDRLLLCSDGLTEHVPGPTELEALLEHDDLDDAARRLIALANERGGRDNVTAVVVSVEASDEEQGRALGGEVRRALRMMRRVGMLESVSFADLARVASLTEIHRVEPGEAVLKQGAPVHALYVVLDGAFELRRGEQVLARLEPGDHVGDTTLLVRRPCRTTLAATPGGEAGRLLCLRGERFSDLTARRPWLGVALLRELAHLLGTELMQATEPAGAGGDAIPGASSRADTEPIEVGPHLLF